MGSLSLARDITPAHIRLLGLLTGLSYLFFGYWLSRNNIQILDDVTSYFVNAYDYHASNKIAVSDNAKLNNAILSLFYFISLPSKYIEVFITYLTSRFSLIQLATVATVVTHQIVYWTLSLPSFIYQFIPSMRKLKIQKNKDVPKDLQIDCFQQVMFNQWVIETPLILFNYFFCAKMSYGLHYNSLPQWYQIVGSMIGCLAIEDTWHFFAHWYMHNNTYLYSRVHKLHHKFVTPIGMQAEYAHPLEIGVLGIGFTLGCTIYCTHFFCTWFWMCIRLLETIEAHGGYNVNLYNNVLHYLPFYGGAKFHDFHHSHFVGNFSSTFTYWDSLFGTDTMYNKFLNKAEAEEIRNLKNMHRD